MSNNQTETTTVVPGGSTAPITEEEVRDFLGTHPDFEHSAFLVFRKLRQYPLSVGFDGRAAIRTIQRVLDETFGTYYLIGPRGGIRWGAGALTGRRAADAALAARADERCTAVLVINAQADAIRAGTVADLLGPVRLADDGSLPNPHLVYMRLRRLFRRHEPHHDDLGYIFALMDRATEVLRTRRCTPTP